MTPSPPKPCEMSWQGGRSLVFGPTSTHKLPFCAEERDSKNLKPKHRSIDRGIGVARGALIAIERRKQETIEEKSGVLIN